MIPNATEHLPESSRFDLQALAATLPESADTMLVDIRLTDESAASARLFRVYRPVPAHFHRTCDEYLLVIRGRARFVVGDQAPAELAPGQMQFFRRGVVHGFTEILEHPFVMFSVDTPRRDPSDVTFVDAASGNVDTFLKSLPRY
jgi:mannose-6-phosphate isomerase-like protein (cupin superfamily)